MSHQDLHDRDFYGWTQAMARALRNGTVAAADMQHIADEVEDMGNSERRALASRLQVLLMHLLKWHYQPQHRSRSWRLTVELQRVEIERLLRDNPSLRREVPPLLPDVYPAARLAALAETGLADEALPEACPFTIEALHAALEP